MPRTIGKLVLSVFGWRIEGNLPNTPKLITIVAPHTSNWDFLLGMAGIFALGIEVHWLGKNTLFRWPSGGLMRWLGGISVDRSAPGGFVAQSASAFRRREGLVLCITPEGTRSRVQYWKTGFYHIARAADVPIVLCFLDYSRRVLGLGPTVILSDDLDAEMASIRSFYRDIPGKHRDRQTA